MIRPAIPFPTPIVVHKPQKAKYPWGEEPLIFGYVTRVSTGHFMQPNSLDFELALKWRALESQLAHAKEALLHQQQQVLVDTIRAYLQVCEMICLAYAQIAMCKSHCKSQVQ